MYSRIRVFLTRPWPLIEEELKIFPSPQGHVKRRKLGVFPCSIEELGIFPSPKVSYEESLYLIICRLAHGLSIEKNLGIFPSPQDYMKEELRIFPSLSVCIRKSSEFFTVADHIASYSQRVSSFLRTERL